MKQVTDYLAEQKRPVFLGNPLVFGFIGGVTVVMLAYMLFIFTEIKMGALVSWEDHRDTIWTAIAIVCTLLAVNGVSALRYKVFAKGEGKFGIFVRSAEICERVSLGQALGSTAPFLVVSAALFVVSTIALGLHCSQMSYLLKEIMCSIEGFSFLSFIYTFIFVLELRYRANKIYSVNGDTEKAKKFALGKRCADVVVCKIDKYYVLAWSQSCEFKLAVLNKDFEEIGSDHDLVLDDDATTKKYLEENVKDLKQGLGMVYLEHGMAEDATMKDVDAESVVRDMALAKARRRFAEAFEVVY